MKSCVPLMLAAAFLSLPTLVSGTVFDYDDDGDVDLVDYEVFFDCFTGPATPADPSCVIFDENEDLRVDLHDFGGFQGAFTGPGPFSITFTELAGNSLSVYPHFEYVKAFNENATVEVAIDPLRFPEIVGQTGDIYVVEAKTASGWDVDPTLVDETNRRTASRNVRRDHDSGEHVPRHGPLRAQQPGVSGPYG
ncbi:MAG: hypothetical protein JSV78_07110 [Phycisphaerales bacterium]|nr:MAG: hypothetical protein JSV78_07110 [Phycisphaerales bacterium]